MSKQSKLKKLLEVFDPSSGTKVDFSQLDEQIGKLKEALTEKIQAQTIDDVLSQLDKFKKRLDFKSLFEAMATLESALDQKIKGISGQMSEEISTLRKLLASDEASTKDQISSIASRIDNLKKELVNLTEQKKIDVAGLKNKLEKLLDFSLRAQDTFIQIEKNVETNKDEAKKNVKTFSETIEKLRVEFNNRISNLGGGQANRQITVNSSTSTLTKYNDINLQNSSSVGWRVTVDDTNRWVSISPSLLSGGGDSTNAAGGDKQIQFNDGGTNFGADVAFQWGSSILSVGQQGSVRGAIDLAGATAQTIRIQTPSTAGAWTLTLPANDGTAGQYLLSDGNGITQWASVTAVGGSGITRSVSVITANTTGGEAAITDYVYIASAIGLQFTLPTAIGNTNLYTVKNFTGSSVLVGVTAGQAIDQSATALMPTMNESLSFISNNSVWGVV